MRAQARLQRRVELAIKRAARRYCSEYYFIAPSGARVQITAVKRVAGSEEFDGMDAATLARRVELVLPASDFTTLCDRFAVDGQHVELWRKSQVAEISCGDVETRYQIDPARPFLLNSPDNGSVRVFAYQIKS